MLKGTKFVSNDSYFLAFRTYLRYFNLHLNNVDKYEMLKGTKFVSNDSYFLAFRTYLRYFMHTISEESLKSANTLQ
jgi:hypothetical protein